MRDFFNEVDRMMANQKESDRMRDQRSRRELKMIAVAFVVAIVIYLLTNW